jgi:hypothetical protein
MLLRAHDPFSGHVVGPVALDWPAITISADTVAQRVTDALAGLGVIVPATEPVPEPPVATQPAKAIRKRGTRRRRATAAEVKDAVRRMDQ